MSALVEHGIRCCYEVMLFLLCPDRSVCILIKTEMFSFSQMLRRELYLWLFAKKLNHGWISTMSSSNEISWKLPPRNEVLVAPLTNSVNLSVRSQPCFNVIVVIPHFQVTFLFQKGVGTRSHRTTSLGISHFCDWKSGRFRTTNLVK